jgi:hypothetical protein
MGAVQNDIDIDAARGNNPTGTAATSQASLVFRGLQLLSPREVAAVAGGPEVDVSSGVTP